MLLRPVGCSLSGHVLGAHLGAARQQLAGDGAVPLLTKSNSVLYGKPGRSSSAQKTKILQVDPADIGKIIGKGGETVRGLIADHGLANVDVDDEGAVMISGKDQEQMDACAAKILELTAEDVRGGGRKQRAAYDGPMPEVGETYASEVVSIKTFGAFVSFGEAFPGLEGLCHISELAPDRVRNIEKFISVGDAFDVKVLAIDEDSGKLKLSRKAALADKVRDSR